MAIKHYEIDGIGQIRVQKRRGSKSMRLRISNDGTVTIGVPFWVPYKTALDYAKKQQDWILRHRPKSKVLMHGQKIGRTHTLMIEKSDLQKVRVKLREDLIIVSVPRQLDHNHEQVQTAAKKGAKKALIAQSSIISQNLAQLAQEHGYEYRSHNFKFMKSKWGSCNNEKHITLNYRLLDLPNHLVEYVLLHELVHLNHMNHGSEYWAELANMLPNYKSLKKEMRSISLSW